MSKVILKVTLTGQGGYCRIPLESGAFSLFMFFMFFNFIVISFSDIGQMLNRERINDTQRSFVSKCLPAGFLPVIDRL